jgi:hypothetical protein
MRRQNVADALTKSLPRPALSKHRQYMWGTRIPFSAFYLLRIRSSAAQGCYFSSTNMI